MIYLLHSTIPVGTPGRGGARHYLGYTTPATIEHRLYDHLHGRSRIGLIRAFLEKGAELYLVRLWEDGGPALEKYLKRSGHLDKHCCLCQQTRGHGGSVTQATPPMSMLPLSKLQLRRRRRGSGGASWLGNLITNTGAFLHAPSPVTTTWSAGVGGMIADAGGSPSTAIARTRRPAGGSAGTKQPSTSAGGTAVQMIMKGLSHEVD